MSVVVLDAGIVKSLIPRTLPLFFARHGQFAAAQQQAIPPIVAGQDALVIAATASGKTEAVIAPLLERYWQQLRQPGLAILYICPTWGTRVGAKALGFDGRVKTLKVSQLPGWLQQRQPHEIEDVLCIFKDKLKVREQAMSEELIRRSWYG